MTAKKKASASKNQKTKKSLSFSLSKQQQILLGSFLLLLGIALLFSFISYFFNWQADQSTLGDLTSRDEETQNWLSKFGSNIGHFFIYDGFGISSFIFAILVGLTGVYLFFDYVKSQLKKFWFWGILRRRCFVYLKSVPDQEWNRETSKPY